MNASYRFSAVALLSLAAVLCGLCELGFCGRQDQFSIIRTNFGRIDDPNLSRNNKDAQTLGLFAVQEHNKQQNALLEFGRVLSSREQVVAGKMYHLTLEAIDSGKKKIYCARVWVKPWMNFKQLEKFELARNVRSFVSSEVGVGQGN